MSSVAMRRPADVNVWTSRRAGDRRSESRIRNSVQLKKIQERLPFLAVGMKRDIHRIAMIQSPSLVNRALSKNGDRQFALESVLEEPLHLPCVTEPPT